MKALPQATAIGHIQHGTMAGKLNGVMPAHDAHRLADRPGVHVGADLLGELAVQVLGDAAGELDDLEAAADLALGVVEGLAVLGERWRASSSVRLSIRLLRLNITCWRRSGGVAPQASCAFCATFTAASISASEANATLAVTSPVAGLVMSPVRPLLPAHPLAVDVMPDFGRHDVLHLFGVLAPAGQRVKERARRQLAERDPQAKHEGDHVTHSKSSPLQSEELALALGARHSVARSYPASTKRRATGVARPR